MKRGSLAAALVAALAWAAVAARPVVTREALAALEKKFDHRIQSYSLNDPFELLGNTRGVYLPDYGVVFTSEVNLVASAVVTPFRQIQQLRQKKLKRLEDLKRIMRAMMVDSATALRGVPREQRIAVGVSLFRFHWEDSRGLPAVQEF